MADELKGAEELRRTLARVGAKTPKEAAAGLYQETLVVKEVAFHRCPKDTGNLRDSHGVTKPKITPGDISTAIYVGGPAAPYAVYVHENLEARHPIGEAKWLERTVHEAAANIVERVAKRIDLNRVVR